MKKLLLIINFIAISIFVMAQGVYYYPHFYYDKMSDNGLWLSEQVDGSVSIYYRADTTYWGYAPSDDYVTEYYAEGMGNCWSNTGILVGSTSDMNCAYWQNGEWHTLDINVKNIGMNSANGITLEGSRIVGSVGIAEMNLGSSQMIKPVYWDRQSDGTYGVCQDLPCPETDFCGRTPQYISAIFVSEDGKTILGQIVDWSGMYCYPIIYTQDNNGKWSYRTIDEDILYPAGTQFAEWPGDEPEAPDPTGFMTEEELAAYLLIYIPYMEEYNRFLNGEISWEELPQEPDPTEFIITNAAAYNDAMSEYKNILNTYYQKSAVFEQVLQEAMYGTSFTFNNVMGSVNGKYYFTTLTSVDISDPLNPKQTSTPVRFETTDLTNAMTRVDGATDMIASSVMDNGTMIAQTPAFGYARNSFIVSPDGKNSTNFVSYVTDRNTWAGEKLKEFSIFDVIYSQGYDDYNNPILAIAEDSIVSGSVSCNRDGSIFSAYMFDEWSESSLANFVRQYAYQIDFNELAAVKNIIDNKNSMQAYVANNTLYLSDDVEYVTLFDMQGHTIYHTPNNGPTIQLPKIAQGIYVVRLISNDKRIENHKIMIK